MLHRLLILFFLYVPCVHAQFKSTLILGDSHTVGPFGEVLDSYFRSKSDRVKTVASCGTSPKQWLAGTASTRCGYFSKNEKGYVVRSDSHKGGSFSKEVQSMNPDLVVMAHGTNILGSRANVDGEIKSIREIAKQIRAKGAKCVWVGPPQIKKPPHANHLNYGAESIRKTVEIEGCLFIDSRKLTSYPARGGDGIHYSGNLSREWGRKVTQEIEKSMGRLAPSVKRQRVQSPQSGSGQSSSAQ